MNEQHQRVSLNTVLISFLAMLAVAGIVLAALAFDVLWSLIGGVFIVGLILIGLAWVGVNLFSRWTDARIKDRTLQYSHIESMANLGYLPNDNRYTPMLPAPDDDYDIPVSTSGQTDSTVKIYREDALNLLALSLQWQRDKHRPDPNQVIPFHAARKNEYFRDVAIWMGAVQFLLIHQMAIERYSGKRKIGTFITGRTLEQAYQQMNQAAPLHSA